MTVAVSATLQPHLDLPGVTTSHSSGASPTLALLNLETSNSFASLQHLHVTQTHCGVCSKVAGLVSGWAVCLDKAPLRISLLPRARSIGDLPEAMDADSSCPI